MQALVPAGGGHQSVARAIAQALHELDATVAVDTVDVSGGGYGPSLAGAIPGAYALLTVHFPFLWHAIFHATNGRRRYEVAERALGPFVVPRVKAVLRAHPADVVVALNPVLGSLAAQARSELGLGTPLGVVISDMFDLHAGWYTPGAAWHAVPTVEARQCCLDAGAPPDAVHLTGFPVGKDFTLAARSRPALRRDLGLPEDGPVVLVVGGGEGFGRVGDIARALLAADLGAYVAVICGRNEPLRRRIERILPPRAGQAQGYVTNMADWMHAADVLVTKAGPNTIMEAVQCRLPFVITGAIPGQEEGNVSFVRANGLGLIATRPREIVAAVAELLRRDGTAASLKAAMARLGQADAARRVAELILQT